MWPSDQAVCGWAKNGFELDDRGRHDEILKNVCEELLERRCVMRKYMAAYNTKMERALERQMRKRERRARWHKTLTNFWKPWRKRIAAIRK